MAAASVIQQSFAGASLRRIVRIEATAAKKQPTKSTMPSTPFSTNTQRKSLWGCTQLVCTLEKSRSSSSKYSWSRTVKLPAPTPVSGWSAIIREVILQIMSRPPSRGRAAGSAGSTKMLRNRWAKKLSAGAVAMPPAKATSPARHTAASPLRARRDRLNRAGLRSRTPIVAAVPASTASQAARDCRSRIITRLEPAATAASPRHFPWRRTTPHRHQGRIRARMPA